MGVQETRERLEPWPLFEHKCGSQVMTFFTTSSDDETSVPRAWSIPDLENKKVWNCCHGWLILSNGNQFSLLDPVSLESISLPCVEVSNDIVACVLSSDPNSPSSMVFLFHRRGKVISYCHIHGEDKQWIRHYYENDIHMIMNNYYVEDHLHKPIACNGKLYCLSYRRPIYVQIEVTEKEETVVLQIQPLIKLPTPLEQSTRRLKITNLVESCGEIFAINIAFEERRRYEKFGNEIIGVEVYRLNVSANAWERVVSVGDRAFFSCGCGIAFSLPANNLSGTIKKNHLYFTRRGDLHLYSYDIEEGTLSVRLPSPTPPTPWDSPMLIMPHTRAINSFREATGKNGKDKQNWDEVMEAAEKEEHEPNPRNLLDLNLDMLNCISRKLNYFAYKIFGAVSTILRKAAPPSEVNRFVSPWLLCFQKNKGVFSMVCPEHSDRYIVQIPESLRDATLCHCKDGWLLMCKYTNATGHQLSINFVNPFTKNVIRYPDLSLESFRFARFGFSGSPTSSSCVVIVVTFYGDGTSDFVNICSSREEGWKCFNLRVLYNGDWSFSRNLVYADGAFYFMSHFGQIGVLRLDGVRRSWSIHEKTKRNYIADYQGFLAEYNGELVSVFISDTGKWLVFKLNHATLSWNRIRTLGKRTMYVSRMSSVLMSAETPEMEDKIYLSSFHENGAMVSLCLKTGKYRHVSGGVPLEDLCGISEQLRSCWIRPN